MDHGGCCGHSYLDVHMEVIVATSKCEWVRGSPDNLSSKLQCLRVKENTIKYYTKIIVANWNYPIQMGMHGHTSHKQRRRRPE